MPPVCVRPCRRGLKLDVADEETDNKYREQYFNFYDARLMGTEWAKQPNVELTTEFFRLLALCHTVIPDGAQQWGTRVLWSAAHRPPTPVPPCWLALLYPLLHPLQKRV